MQLIDLVRKLVDNPDEREAFKEAPDKYMALQEELLQSYLRTLQDAASSRIILETATVMGIRTRQAYNLNNASDDAWFDLEHYIVFLKPRLPFFIEYQYPLESEEKEHEYTCMLLHHSYIEVREQGNKKVVAMRLHLCFVDPQDSQDQPQVVDIRTMIEPTHPNPLDLGDQLAYLTLPKGYYVLLRGDSEFSCKLGPGSKYNIDTKELILTFAEPV